MEKTLPDFIRENKDLRDALLEQEGGIMKYLAGHLDANGNAELFRCYQKHCVDLFFEKNKWDWRKVWKPGEETERTALGMTEHIWKELKYQKALEPVLSAKLTVFTEKVKDFTNQYLTYAYTEYRRRMYPGGMTDNDVYQEVVELFNQNQGLAYKCMEIVLREHHAKGNMEEKDADMLTEFEIRQYVGQLTLGHFIQLRQAIAEMLDGKTKEECVLLATDMMTKVKPFSQMIHNEGWVHYVREVKFPADDKAWFDRTGKHLNIDCVMIGAEEKESDGKWLRNVTQHAFLKEFSAHVKIHSMRYCLALFDSLLRDLGHFWAAQLLVHDIDMHDLEKEHSCILTPVSKPVGAVDDYVDYSYYVDRISGDKRGQCCVYDEEQAKELLDNLRGRQTPENNSSTPDDSHGKYYYGKDILIFHENLDPEKIAKEIIRLDRNKSGGKRIADRNFILILYNVFTNHPGCTITRKRVDMLNWVKFNCKIYFDTNHLRNVDLDEEEKQKEDIYHNVFANKQPNGKWYFKKTFYRIDPITNSPKKSIDGAW